MLIIYGNRYSDSSDTVINYIEDDEGTIYKSWMVDVSSANSTPIGALDRIIVDDTGFIVYSGDLVNQILNANYIAIK